MAVTRAERALSRGLSSPSSPFYRLVNLVSRLFIDQSTADTHARLHRTTPNRRTNRLSVRGSMQDTGRRHTSADERSDALRVAFRELHGRRLHAFALLMTLGNHVLAARLSAEAIAAATARGTELRHPERAAAWLRARVVATLPRRREPSPTDERVALEPLGVSRGVIDGLAALSAHERAALVASDLERLDTRDAGAIVGRSPRALERLLAGARRRYMRAHASSSLAEGSILAGAEEGAVIRRIRSVAERALA
jgi:DNA-directed RNA polymerase specialized sigma24 family protein